MVIQFRVVELSIFLSFLFPLRLSGGTVAICHCRKPQKVRLIIISVSVVRIGGVWRVRALEEAVHTDQQHRVRRTGWIDEEVPGGQVKDWADGFHRLTEECEREISQLDGVGWREMHKGDCEVLAGVSFWELQAESIQRHSRHHRFQLKSEFRTGKV